MSKNYYGLVSGLKQLFSGRYNEPGLGGFYALLQDQLEPQDLYQCLLLLYPFDNQNILAQLKGIESFNNFGNLSLEELTTSINKGYSEDVYMHRLLESTPLLKDGVSAMEKERAITQCYVDFVAEFGNPFVKAYTEFDTSAKNLLARNNCQLLKLNFEEQYIEGGYFNLEELRRLSASDLSTQHPLLKEYMDALESKDPIDRKLKEDEIKWKFIDQQSFFNYFSIEKVQAHLIKLIDLERWSVLDEERGGQLLNQYVEQINQELETLIQ